MKEPLAELESTHEVFRGPKLSYKAIEDTIKKAISEYDTQCGQVVAEASVRAAELASAGDTEGASTAIMLAGGVAQGSPWAWSVSNLHLMDARFLLPNSMAINAELRRQLTANPDEAPVLSGVTFTRGAK